MRWRGAPQSENVEDLRGRGVGMRVGGLGIGGLLVLVVLTYLAGGDPLALLTQIPVETGAGGGGQGPAPGQPDEAGQFVSAVLKDTETVWTGVFPQQLNQAYAQPRLRLFSGRVESACGFASAAVGPFYCPGDSYVYLDTAFFAELDQRFGAPGDFAQAYVIAHEVGHHVQNLIGLTSRVSQLQQQTDEKRANQLSVRLELQADCFAGVWGHHARIPLEEGDVEEGLRAAAAIGDDRLQHRSQGQVVPESFTHGSSTQRVEWLTRGLKSGQVKACDTFGGS